MPDHRPGFPSGTCGSSRKSERGQLMAAGAYVLNGRLVQANLEIVPPQILNLENPITILTGPGAGQAIIPLSVVCSYRFGSTPYANPGIGDPSAPGSPDVQLCYFGPSLLPVLEFVSLYNLLLQTQDTVQVWTAPQQLALPRAEIEGKPIVLCNPTGATNFVNGDGTLTLSILYVISDL
jgi:hypothetical protein